MSGRRPSRGFGDRGSVPAPDDRGAQGRPTGNESDRHRALRGTAPGPGAGDSLRHPARTDPQHAAAVGAEVDGIAPLGRAGSLRSRVHLGKLDAAVGAPGQQVVPWYYAEPGPVRGARRGRGWGGRRGGCRGGHRGRRRFQPSSPLLRKQCVGAGNVRREPTWGLVGSAPDTFRFSRIDHDRFHGDGARRMAGGAFHTIPPRSFLRGQRTATALTPEKKRHSHPPRS